MSDFVIKNLSKENMSEDEMENRDYLLDQLEFHICDANAHVRAKVLQLWTNMQYEAKIPLNRISVILEKARKRLSDKSQVVRKFAIILFTKFIESNPFAAKVRLKTMKDV